MKVKQLFHGFSLKKWLQIRGNFKALSLTNKKRQNYTAEYISIDQKNIKTSWPAKLLRVHIDDKLNFHLHITKICGSAANQLYALTTLRMFLNFEEKKTLINSCSRLYNSNTHGELKIVRVIECPSNRKLLYFCNF